MKHIILIFILAFIGVSAHAQIIKGAGILYFDSLLNVNANTNGSEYAASIKLKKLYRWDRTLSQWIQINDGNGLYTIDNDGDTVRVTVAIIPDGSGLTFRDTSGTVVLTINNNSVTAFAGDAGIQAVKSLGYTLIKGDSLIFQIGGSYGTAGQVITATGDGGAVWGSGGSGETNTASNLGSGTGLFAGKVGVDLQFKSIAVGPNLSVSSNSTTVTISHSYNYYTNDAAAASGGVALGSVYKVDIGNPYGMTWGTLKTRNE